MNKPQNDPDASQPASQQPARPGVGQPASQQPNGQPAQPSPATPTPQQPVSQTAPATGSEAQASHPAPASANHYGAADPTAAGQAPSGQQPYAQPTPPQPPYAQPSPYTAPIPPASPYASEPAKPSKKWPWIVLACVLAFLMGLGGCVGCTTIGVVADSLHNRADSVHSHDFDDLPYGYGYDSDDAPDSDYYGGFTLSDIQNAAGDLPSNIDESGKASPGVYIVGRDIDAGMYFLQGNASTESEFYLFSPEGSGTYSLDTAVTYTGNYFADLEEGQVIAFMPSSATMLMIPDDQADFQPQAPYNSGLYRVGQDIPAGTYTITVSPDAPRSPSQDYAAYVMQDLDFGDDSITDSVALLRGSTQTVTVQDGEWLELFGTTATPAQ